MRRVVLIVAGGTGGHIFSGLAIAYCLIQQYNCCVKWLGVAGCMECELVPKFGIDIQLIDVNGIIGKTLATKLRSCINVISIIKKSRNIINILRPNIILGMGGYVTGPSILAAWTLSVPVVIHEQNAVAGFTNRLLKKIATKVLQAFPNSLLNAEVVGNPIRDEILLLPSPIERFSCRRGPLRILIIGGSQGAKILNKIVPEVIIRMSDKLTVWHQVGSNKSLEKVKNIYLKSQVATVYQVVSFIDDIAHAYSWADLIVCRSGALTVSEICAVGLAAIFVPFMHKDYHQYWNAIPLQRLGAAKIIEESEFTVDRVFNMFSILNRNILLKMSESARTLRSVDSAKRIAQILMSIN